jgi:hypothetical protein
MTNSILIFNGTAKKSAKIASIYSEKLLLGCSHRNIKIYKAKILLIELRRMGFNSQFSTPFSKKVSFDCHVSNYGIIKLLPE